MVSIGELVTMHTKLDNAFGVLELHARNEVTISCVRRVRAVKLLPQCVWRADVFQAAAKIVILVGRRYLRSGSDAFAFAGNLLAASVSEFVWALFRLARLCFLASCSATVAGRFSSVG